MMKHLNKIPSVVQILFAEWLAVMFLFPVASKFYEFVRPNVAYKSLPLDKFDYVLFVLGLLLYFWSLREIFRPRVKTDSWINLKTASTSGGDYPFISTHPSYVLIDLLACGLWWFARWAWSTGWQERVYQGTILLAMASVIPICRLVAWYILRLRPKGEREELENAWKPVAAFASLLLAIALVSAVVIFYVERKEARELAEREARLTVVDTSNWKGSETFDGLRDDAHEGPIATRVIRLRATQKGANALTCTNDAGQGEFATVLATLGKYDDVLIFSYAAPSRLAERAANNQGKTIESMGRLFQMPDKIPTWKKYCGLEKLSPRPRWAFEEERP